MSRLNGGGGLVSGGWDGLRAVPVRKLGAESVFTF